MADETKVPLPKHLDEIKGNISEQRAAKIAVIRDHGYDAWQKLVSDSRATTKR